MTFRFKRSELPLAFSMIAAAERVRPRRDGRHPYDQYFLLWTAFQQMYTAIAARKGYRHRILMESDGSIRTIQNGHVKIPQVHVVDEREQVRLASQEVDPQLKDTLVHHPGTAFFAGRIPFWEGQQIEYDAFGQRVNGVIQLQATSDPRYPVWSPIDSQIYEDYLADPAGAEGRDFLTDQLIDLLYTVRTNLIQFSRKFDDSNDIAVVENALPLLTLIVVSFTG